MSDFSTDKGPGKKPPRTDMIRRILSIPLTIIVIIYFVVEDLFLGLLRPLFRWLGRLSPFIALGNWLKTLPPYVALVVFAVPFILLEPIKVFSLFWIGIGHFVSGTILLLWSYILSLLIVERLFQAMRGQLLSIVWVAWCYDLVVKVKTWAFDRLKATAIWRALRPIGRRIAMVVRTAAAWLRDRFLRVLQSVR